MDQLIKAMKARFEKNAKDGKSENIGEVMKFYIAEGYSEAQVKDAFFAVLKYFSGDEYD